MRFDAAEDAERRLHLLPHAATAGVLCGSLCGVPPQDLRLVAQAGPDSSTCLECEARLLDRVPR